MSDRAKPARPNLKKFGRRILREWIAPLAIVIVVFGTFRSAIADWSDVPTGSMEPTIMPGDRIFVNKVAYGLRVPFTKRWITRWADPARGDIVICFSPADGTRLVKRLIGQPGDVVELRNNGLIINGRRATYSDLDRDTIEQIPPDQRPSLMFATENLDGAKHAMMLTRGIPAIRSFGPITVPEDSFLVMGDNRDRSADSRIFGFIDRRQIIGRSPAVALSVDPEHHYLPRWGRFFRRLR